MREIINNNKAYTKLIGYVVVDSGRIVISDPCEWTDAEILDRLNTYNENDLSDSLVALSNSYKVSTTAALVHTDDGEYAVYGVYRVNNNKLIGIYIDL